MHLRRPGDPPPPYRRPIRNIDGMAEIDWARVEQRRAEYEAWTDARLTLDTSAEPPERLLAEAIRYLA